MAASIHASARLLTVLLMAYVQSRAAESAKAPEASNALK
jgi:hypothetical protein